MIFAGTKTLVAPPASESSPYWLATVVDIALDGSFAVALAAGKPWEGGSTALESEYPVNWRYARAFLLRYLARRLDGIDPGDIEDVTQEALIRLHRVTLREPVRNLEALMLTIAKCCSRDFFRKRHRWQMFLEPLDSFAEAIPAPGRDPQDRLGDPKERIEFAVLEFFLGRRSEMCRSLAIEFFEDRSWSAVAKRMHEAPETIRKRWERCCRMLKEAIKKSGGSLPGFEGLE